MYLDIFLKSPLNTLAYLAKIDMTNIDIHLSCLEVFAKKTALCPLPFLEKDLQSTHPKIHEMALKVLVRNPQKNSEELLSKFLEDPSETMRATAASGLNLFTNDSVLSKLTLTLKDPAWIVRLQAALSLKKMGDDGLTILKNQNPKIDKTSYEVAQYALDFLD